MAQILTTPVSSFSRIYYVNPLTVGRLSGLNSGHAPKNWEALCERVRAMGFNSILTAPLWLSADDTLMIPDDPDLPNPRLDDGYSLLDCLVRLAKICSQHHLSLMLDLTLDRAADNGALARANPLWYGKCTQATAQNLRHSHDCDAVALRKSDAGQAPPEFIKSWGQRLARWVEAGVAGFRCSAPHRLAAADWQALIQPIHANHKDCRFLAWTPGLTPDEIKLLAGAGFDATFSSLPWWDYRAPWLVEEHARLRAIAPVIALVADPAEQSSMSAASQAVRQQYALRALWTASVLGDGLMVPMGFEQDATEPAVANANQWIKHTHNTTSAQLYFLQGANAAYTALLRRDCQTGAAMPAPARLLILNPNPDQAVELEWRALQARLPDSYALIRPWDNRFHPLNGEPKLHKESCFNGLAPTLNQVFPATLPAMMPPGGHYVMQALPAASVIPTTPSSDEQRKNAIAALRAPRIVIENVTPCIDNAAHAIKRTIGEETRIEADVFMDGHDHICVELLWRAADEPHWHHIPMALLENDRWQASFFPERLGRHEYAIQAWRDAWATYCDDLQKKVAAKLDVALEAEEGRIMIKSALDSVTNRTPAIQKALSTALQRTGMPLPIRSSPKRALATPAGALEQPPIPAPTQDQINALLSEPTAQVMQEIDTRRFLVRSNLAYPVTVERQAARFANWYELFPRSHSPEPGRHAVFDDVARRMPAIRDMGFDVLYFPPVHPIGLRNRKGKNNALSANPDEPGSPYAIGSEDGGHDAVHPDLGTLDDFRRLVAIAREHNLEIALDFAIQCSPDHPWLAQHPGWFAWRADGSLRYAENPPKRYEDIVNVDFYGPPNTRQTSLWIALRDVVLFWVAQGVRMFRVDNPHTKPLPFWEWLIADIQRQHPDVLFLSEAFTRPKMMYRLAKIGFSQSYTYFTWRETKQELTDYLIELNQSPIADIFRPHFFVNTPDINPRFLQASGRPGFLIRAALATTLSGLWGMYNGFELCEGRALPGKEEYLDSEKYEIRTWDWNRPGNIIAEISQLNRIRRSNPALQTHLGLHFHHCDNGQVIFFSKATAQRDNVVLVAISLDPDATQAATLELPLWEFGLPDDGALDAQDLFNGHRFTWHGKYQTVTLSPQQPFAVWRVAKPE